MKGRGRGIFGGHVLDGIDKLAQVVAQELPGRGFRHFIDHPSVLLWFLADRQKPGLVGPSSHLAAEHNQKAPYNPGGGPPRAASPATTPASRDSVDVHGSGPIDSREGGSERRKVLRGAKCRRGQPQT